MQLGLVLSLLTLSLIVNQSCRSVSRSEPSDLSGVKADAEVETFAMLGGKRIEAAYQKVAASLASMPKEFKLDEALAISSELIELRDYLEIFVHIFPSKADEDQLIEIHKQVSTGIGLLSDFAKLHDADKIKGARPAILNFAGLLSGGDSKQKMSDYLLSINRLHATRRSIPVLNATCWAKVDFIPRLSSPAEEELHDFMKALLRATRSEATEALKLEEITAVEQRSSFQSTRTKARHVLMLQSRFPDLVKNDEDLRKSLGTLKELSTRYEAINDLLLERDLLLAEAKSSSTFDRKIRNDWSETKTWQIRSGSF